MIIQTLVKLFLALATGGIMNAAANFAAMSPELFFADTFSVRSMHSSVAYDGKLWVIGGWVDGYQPDGNERNDIFYSIDGANWRKFRAVLRKCKYIAAVASDRLRILTSDGELCELFQNCLKSSQMTFIYNINRNIIKPSHVAVTFKDRLLLVGNPLPSNNVILYEYRGDSAIGPKISEKRGEVWASRDGERWRLINSEAGFRSRSGHAVAEFNGSLLLIGGLCENENAYKNDVWISQDGASWERLAAAAGFSPRAFHCLTVFNGSIYLTGGRDAANVFADVWRSADGKNWELVTARAAFGPTHSHASLVRDSKLWVLGCASEIGDHYNGFRRSDAVWRSSDGLEWTRAGDGNVPFGSGKGRLEIAELNGRYYFYDGGAEIFCYSSDDLVEWKKESSMEPFIDSLPHATDFLAFNNRLIGIDSALDSTVQSPNGKSWKLVKALFEDTEEVCARVSQGAAGERQAPGGDWRLSSRPADYCFAHPGTAAFFKGNYFVYSEGLWSSRDCSLWIRECATPPFGSRLEYGLFHFRDALWIAGGRGCNSGSARPESVWRSDDGLHWELELSWRSVPFGPRACFPAIVFGDKMWMIGGSGNYQKEVFSDVWCSGNGTDWKKAADSTALGWRHSHSGAVFNGRIWIIGGKAPLDPTVPSYRTSHRFLNDVWSSANGTDWNEEY